MAPLILAAIAGLASAGGSAYAANRNRQSIKDQMAFQERMSSTAAQRSVLDYTKAGLNPALAYERSASSPGGAAATIEDAVGKGISSARDTAALNQAMKIAMKQSEADIILKTEQAGASKASNMQSTASANLADQQRISEIVNREFGITQQPHTARLAAANALGREITNRLDTLQIPGAENTAAHERRLGELKGFMGTARTLSEIIKSISPIIKR